MTELEVFVQGLAGICPTIFLILVLLVLLKLGASAFKLGRQGLGPAFAVAIVTALVVILLGFALPHAFDNMNIGLAQYAVSSPLTPPP